MCYFPREICRSAKELLSLTVDEPSNALFLFLQLVRGHGVDRELTWLVDNVDWYFLPVFNPDGYVYSWTKDRLWRKNRAIHNTSNKNSSQCVGVDLNRNWDAHWAGKAPNYSCAQIDTVLWKICLK